MLRRIALPVSILCLAGLSLLATNCGSSSNNNTTACTGGPYNVAGDWNLTLDESGGDSSGEGGAISTSGETLFFDGFGDVVSLPDISGTCSFTGSATVYFTPIGAGDGPSTESLSVSGNVASTTSITGTASADGSSEGFSAAPFVALATAPTGLSGSGWEGEIFDDPGENLFDLTFTPTGTNADMTVSGDNTFDNCTVSGTLTQELSGSTALNVFDAALAFTGAGCAYPTITGLAFESSSDDFLMNSNTEGTYLYAISSSSSAVMEVFVPAGGHAQTSRHHGVPWRF